MSKKSWFKGKKVDLVEAPPRALEEITKENNQVLYELGAAQYTATVYQKMAEQLAAKSQTLNQEAKRAKDLAAASTETKENA